ncbi:MAG: malonic semialdehyde reductase [Candidatus Nanopelagicales bacterium]
MTATLVTNPRAIDERSSDVLFREAHTAYAFDGTPVSSEQLEEIYDLVRHAPTAMNSQPLRITFITSQAAKARLLPHLAEGNRAKAQSAPVIAILAADTDFHEHLPRVLPQAPQAKEMFSDDAARTKAASFNAAIQAGYFILAVRAVGLDAGPMGGVDTAGIDAEFFTDPAQKSFLIVNIGHAAKNGTFPRNPRLEHHEAVTTL